MSNPRVSIIISNYNRVHLIGETIDSVLAQSYLNWECIVVDDRSTDYIKELMEFYCEGDNRIQYHQRPIDRPKGANACRNYGFEISKGEYIQYLDSDDLLSEDKIEAQVKLLMSNNEIDVCFCKWVSFKDNVKKNEPQGRPRLYRLLKTPKELFDFFGAHGGFLPPHVYLVKRQKIIKAGGWNEYLMHNQDGEFFSRLLLLVDNLIYSEVGTAYYRRGFDNDATSVFNNPDKVEDVIRSWKMIEQAHKIRYKIDAVPYVENAKKDVFYSIRKTGFIEIAKKHPFFFKNEFQKWELQNKRQKSFSRKLKRVKKFIEVKIIDNLSGNITK